MSTDNSSSPAKKYEYIRMTFTYEGKRYSVRGKTESEAYEKKAELLAQLKRGEIGISSNMSAAAWCREWLETYVKPRVRQPGQPKRANTMSPKSYLTYTEKMEGYIIPGLGALKLKDVRDTHLMRILNAEAGKSFSHVSKIRMIIKGAFSQAVISRLIPFDPSARLTLPANEKRSRRSLTDYERQIFNEVALEHPHGLWLRTLLATGIRPGESAPLQVQDFDFNAKLLHICKSVESGTYLVSDPKTSSSIRFIPIPDDLIPDLQKAIEGKSPTDLVFPQTTNAGAMMTQTCIKRYWESFTREMDLAMGAEHTPKGHIYDPSDLLPNGDPIYPDPVNPKQPRNGHKIAPDLVMYCLRHTFGTDMQRAGVPLNITRYLMGHADISTTANIYVHSGKEDALSSLELINEYRAGL